jgi:1-acyl-sn-glycerol-3-phosphate acyltransferase
VQGLEHAQATLAKGPAVLIGNHSGWWDSIVLLALTHFALRGADGYAMMDARNLRRFRFFGWLGVFGVELDEAEDRAASIAYAASLLKHPGAAVWVFPQGAERPVTEPLTFHAGAARIARLADAPVVPFAFCYEFGRYPDPEIYIAVGPALTTSGDERSDVEAQEGAVRDLLLDIEGAVRSAARGEPTFPTWFVKPRRRGGVYAKLLGLLGGGVSSRSTDR